MYIRGVRVCLCVKLTLVLWQRLRDSGLCIALMQICEFVVYLVSTVPTPCI